ncbi:MAG: hypothetical protein K2H21_09525 [Muribaculaceae bacterium]|nr:hypothetical protein [Muribaculaceae bacterium]
MTIAKKIEDRIDLISDGTVFSISDLGLPNDWWENIRVKLSRMVGKGIIQKLSKGRFYKPKKNAFGILKPELSELVKDLLSDRNGNPTGYLTGYSVWNDMGLTTQVASVIMIGSNKRRNPIKRGMFSIKFIYQTIDVTKDNIHLLQILDTIKFIKSIPDTNVAQSVRIVNALIGRLGEKDINKLIILSAKYTPRVRALLGAILDDLGYGSMTTKLYDTLNPETKFKLGLATSDELQNKEKWNIL